MCLNRVTVDFDLDGRSPYERALFLARLTSMCRAAGCRLARTRKGLHVYLDLELGFWARVALRSYLLDDDVRIEIDILRHELGWHRIEETLFEAKCERGGCHREEEVTLEDLERILFPPAAPDWGSAGGTTRGTRRRKR